MKREIRIEVLISNFCVYDLHTQETGGDRSQWRNIEKLISPSQVCLAWYKIFEHLVHRCLPSNLCSGVAMYKMILRKYCVLLTKLVIITCMLQALD